MAVSYFFYDLETSGLSPRSDRIMQFAGQRTDLNFKALGEPFNIKLKLPKDCLPSPKALLLTGLSPLQDGLSEYQFLNIFNLKINTPETIFIGYNNLRFDDEFIRYLNYRNFYDPYKWHWDQNNSRWDILDLVRMTRALRPKDIIWPFDDLKKPVNKLEALTKANHLDHFNAHDALSDVLATIEVAKLIYSKQPQLFNYLKNIRSKKSVIDFLSNNPIFIYTSKSYSSNYLNTAMVALADLNLTEPASALVYDLRESPKDYVDLSAQELADLWRYDPVQKKSGLPFKTIKLNHCPAMAPINVLDQDSEVRLAIIKKKHLKNYQEFQNISSKLVPKVLEARSILDSLRFKKTIPKIKNENLYDGFDSKSDQHKKYLIQKDPLRRIKFSSKSLNELYALFIAYNFQDKLNVTEKNIWKKHLKQKLFTKIDGLSKYDRYLMEFQEASSEHQNSKILKDLKKYTKAILDEYEKS